MAVLTFVTCCDPARAQYLSETAVSVVETRKALAEIGVTVRWKVGGDGGKLPDQAFCAAAEAGAEIDHTAMQLGSAPARGRLISSTLRDSRAEDWIAPLDADDLLVASGWKSLWGTWNPEAEWVGMQRAYDLGVHRQGANSVVQDDRDFAPGEFPYTSPALFHPASVLVRSSLAARVSYPQHLRYVEDLAWVLALTACAPGSLRKPVTLRYRTWDAQLTSESEYLDPEARTDRDVACLAYANAYRVSMGLPAFPADAHMAAGDQPASLRP